MSKVEEVKKILFENGVGSIRGHIARQICQLFETVEPQPDKPREELLLTEEEIQTLPGRGMLPATEYDRQVAKAQHDLDQGHEQATVEKIRRGLEKLFPYSILTQNPLAWDNFWDKHQEARRS